MENNRKEISADELLAKLKANLAETRVPQPNRDAEDVREFIPETKAEALELPGDELAERRQIKYKFRVSQRSDAPAEKSPAKAALEPEVRSAPAAASKAEEAHEETSDIDELMKKFLSPEEYDKFSSRKKPKAKAPEELRDSYREYTIPEAPQPKELSESIRDAEAYASTMDEPKPEVKPEKKSDTKEIPVARIEKINVPRRNGRPVSSDNTPEDATREFDSASVLDVLKKFDENEKTKVVPTVKEESLEDENLRRINDFDETDVNLMIAFGMEDELAKTVGTERAVEYENDIDAVGDLYDEPDEEEEYKPAFEYEAQSQAKQIFAGYKQTYRRVLFKLLASFVLMLLLFIYENIGLFGASLPDFLSPTKYTIVYTMVDLQILLLSGALVWRSLLRGCASIIDLRPTPESVSAVLVFMTLLYHIGVCFMGRGYEPALYSFPVALTLFLTLCYEFMNLKREIYSFNIVSSKKLKYAMSSISDDESALENEAFDEFIDGEPSIFRICKTGFVNGFYRRTGAPSNNTKALSIIIPFALIICAVFFVLGAYKTGSVRDGMAASYAALVFAMPASVLITFSYPFFKASKTAFDMDSAIIGNASLDEYSTASVVSFEDKDVFPSTGVKVKSVKVYGDNRIDRVIYCAASLFRVMGGPLADVLDIATLELGHTDDVSIIDTDTDGIEAAVAGHHIYMGKEDYLRRCGFVPVRDEDDEAIEGGGRVSIMYMVEDGEVSAKLYIEYMIDPDFEFILKRLWRAGVCVGIKTFDPNINDYMLNMRIKLAKYPVKILACRSTEDITKTAEKVDSGIVSKSSAKAMLQTLLLCDKVLHVIRTSVIVKLIAMAVGAAVMGLVLTLGVIGEVSSLYAVLYQLFWVLPIIIIARLLI